MVEAVDAAEPGERATERRRHGVVFVHGVGDQRKSDTLLDFGEPVLDWLTSWYRARGESAPQLSSVALSFSPIDVGETDSLPRATLLLPNGDSWVLAEAWWAASNRRPGFLTMIRWSGRHLGEILIQLWWAAHQRFHRWLHPRPDSTDPSFLARFIDLLNCLGLLVLYPAGAVVGYPALLVLMVLAQVPVRAVQDFVLLKLVRPFLEINAGEFRTYLVDELQAANMRRRVAEAVSWLAVREGCDDVTIVAHSEGAVVSFGMLADPTLLAARHVRKLITFGAGLNKAWQIEPGLERLHGPIPDHIHWLDIWSSYDPVPAGWLQPRVPGGGWAPIFRPSKAVVDEQHLTARDDPNPYAETDSASGETPPAPDVYWPASEQVTNEMNVLADHGAYFENDEQVLVRLAAEIDSPYYRDSRFWRAELRGAVLDRRERVSVLAAGRAIAVLAALAAIGRLWWDLAAQGVGWWDGLSQVPPGAMTAQPIVASLNWLRELIAPVPPLSASLEPLLVLPFWLLGALVSSIPSWALFSGWRAFGWEPWDRRERKAAITAIARAGVVP